MIFALQLNKRIDLLNYHKQFGIASYHIVWTHKSMPLPLERSVWIAMKFFLQFLQFLHGKNI